MWEISFPDFSHVGKVSSSIHTRRVWSITRSENNVTRVLGRLKVYVDLRY